MKLVLLSKKKNYCVNFCIVKRKTNYLTHDLAKWASFYNVDDFVFIFLSNWVFLLRNKR